MEERVALFSGTVGSHDMLRGEAGIYDEADGMIRWRQPGNCWLLLTGKRSEIHQNAQSALLPIYHATPIFTLGDWWQDLLSKGTNSFPPSCWRGGHWNDRDRVSYRLCRDYRCMKLDRSASTG